MDEIFQAVREACSPAVWSKGVEWSRQDVVSGEEAADGTLRLRVAAGAVAPVVILHVEDGEWECSCNGDDPCSHVAAAVIALRRAREAGKPLPKGAGGAAAAQIVHRLVRREKSVALERVLVRDGKEEPLTQPLAALAAGRVAGPRVSATSDELEIDLALGAARDGRPLVTADTPKILAALARLEALTLDGQHVRINPEPVGIVAVVRDEGPGVKITGENDPDIEELFENGVARCASGLRAVRLPPLTPAEQDMLKKGRFFGPRDLGELAGEILPKLRDKKVPLDVRTGRLPGRAFATPRLEWKVETEAHVARLIPGIVYGDPAIARVVSGRLEALGGEVPVRDVAAETALKDKLQREHGLEMGQVLSMPPAEAASFLARKKQSVAELKIHSDLTPSFAVEGADFSLSFSTEGGTKRADPARVLAAWKAEEPLVPLLGGGYAPLPTDWLARYGDRIRELFAAREGRDALPRAALPAFAELCEDLGHTPPEEAKRLRTALISFQSLPPFTPPPALRADLRVYQRDGARWLAGLRTLGLGAVLADDMGLGKTLQTLAVVEKGRRTLVVAPTSLLFNWQSEAARFRPDLATHVYYGPQRTLARDADVVLTSYALLRLDTDLLTRETWDLLVLDEAQALKNPESQVATAARRIDAKFRVALSGTPVENRLEDLHSVMQIVNPGLLGDRAAFAERYSRPIGQGDAAAATRLKARITPVLLRRLKREVAPELPPRTDVVMRLALSAAERDTYDALLAATRRDVVERLETGGNMMEALEALLRLRQACCDPALLPGAKDDGALSTKVETLARELEALAAAGQKALVFSQWTTFLDRIEQGLAGTGVPWLRLDGTTQDRAGVVRRFQEGGADAPPVLLMSLKAGGVGLNLTAADTVYLADPWWNPAAEDQAADRAHRIGQDRPVLVKRLVALDTVEERILLLQEKKRALAAAATTGDAAAALTREDLLALLV